MRTVLVLGLLAALSAGCGEGGSAHAAGTIDVVAAENVYGNIAAQIGGSHVSVTSILTSPDADPHLFEPGTATSLAVAKAKVVIQNGLGYDAFMSRIEDATPDNGGMDLIIADALGIHGKNVNPHLWYDVPRLDQIAHQVADAFVHQDPAHAAAYRHGERRFDRSLGPLRREVASIRRRFRGTPVAYTEPVPGYLVAAAGLRNLAPVSFTRSIEDGSEPSPSGLAEMTALISQHRIRVLLYNSQAVSPITARLRDAARSAGIPVVAVRETLPPGLSFQRWQLLQARALADALAR
jgi:zinc/manganese transport system substrate-binding protein